MQYTIRLAAYLRQFVSINWSLFMTCILFSLNSWPQTTEMWKEIGWKCQTTVISEIFKQSTRIEQYEHVSCDSEILQWLKNLSHLQIRNISVFLNAHYALQKVVFTTFCHILSYRLDFSSIAMVTLSSYRPVTGWRYLVIGHSADDVNQLPSMWHSAEQWRKWKSRRLIFYSEILYFVTNYIAHILL